MKNALIIGNGIAGSCLAWSLMTKGVEVSMMDANFPDAASKVAAGIINPITGRRYVKTWMLETLYPFAKEFYTSIGEKYGTKLWHDSPILRILSSKKEYNDWCARSGDGDYSAWMDSISSQNEWTDYAKKGVEFGVLRGAARIDFPVFNQLTFNVLSKEDRFFNQKIDYEQIPDLQNKFDCIIFCEGYRGRENPYFTNLPWQVVKGEVLIIEFEKSPSQAMKYALKKDIMIVPISTNRFWVGANYEWDFKDSKPSHVGRDFLTEKLSEVLTVPYKIVDHKAAIRPTNKKYRPFLGRHNQHKNLAIFNGLGTKGALLAPFWAQHLAEHLVDRVELVAEVDWQAHRLSTP